MFWANNNSDFLLVLAVIIFSLVLHEYAHAYVSFKLGDYKVKEDKRLSFNPINHIDPVGLMLLLVIGFGWAKPVVVNPQYYKKPVRDITLVALAGPLTNLLIAIIAFSLNMVFKYSDFTIVLLYLWTINIGLCIFNLIPIPPLDGSRILGYFLDARTYKEFLDNQLVGRVILMVLIVSNVITQFMDIIINFIYHLIY